MSADAKAWQEPDGWWVGFTDSCDHPAYDPHPSTQDLPALLTGLQDCAKHKIRWEFRQYPDNQIGLAGYYY